MSGRQPSLFKYLGVTDFEKKIQAQFQRQKIIDQTVVVALSGGLDSVALLDLVSRLSVPLNLKVYAAHVNHNLHVNSTSWVSFCSQLCAEYEIPLEIYDVNVSSNSNLGVEGEARQLRYQALLSHAASVLLLAHHQDDQIETFFLQALRGSGVDGLSGMSIARKDTASGKTIFRPLLNFEQKTVREYVMNRNLTWIEDPSNRDSDFSRNFLRNELLPLIKSRFPGSRGSILNVVENLKDVGTLVQDLASHDIDRCISKNGGFKICRLIELSEVRAINVIREMCRRHGAVAPGRSWLTEVLRQCFFAKSTACVSVDSKEMSVKRYREHIYVLKKIAEIEEGWCDSWFGESTVSLPNDLGYLEFKESLGEGIPKKLIGPEGLKIALGAGSKRFSLGQKRPRRSLRKIWQANGVPPWERSKTPVVFFGNEALFAGNIGLSGCYFAEENQPGITIKWHQGTSTG